jgi:hypothetical protein
MAAGSDSGSESESESDSESDSESESRSDSASSAPTAAGPCHPASALVDSVVPAVRIRQFVLTLPPSLRQLLAWSAELRRWALNAFMRALEKHYVAQAVAEGLVKPRFAAISELHRGGREDPPPCGPLAKPRAG